MTGMCTEEPRITDNPVNKNYLIYKCSAKDMRTIYVPGKVPGWCPYTINGGTP